MSNIRTFIAREMGLDMFGKKTRLTSNDLDLLIQRCIHERKRWMLVRCDGHRFEYAGKMIDSLVVA